MEISAGLDITWCASRRYSDFKRLFGQLEMSHSAIEMSFLPRFPGSTWDKNARHVVAARRRLLQAFLNRQLPPTPRDICTYLRHRHRSHCRPPAPLRRIIYRTGCTQNENQEPCFCCFAPQTYSLN